MIVDFPAPLGPMMPMASPRRIVSVVGLSASRRTGGLLRR